MEWSLRSQARCEIRDKRLRTGICFSQDQLLNSQLLMGMGRVESKAKIRENWGWKSAVESYHRTMEWFRLEGASIPSRSNPRPWVGLPPQPTLPRAPSHLACRDGGQQNNMNYCSRVFWQRTAQNKCTAEKTLVHTEAHGSSLLFTKSRQLLMGGLYSCSAADCPSRAAAIRQLCENRTVPASRFGSCKFPPLRECRMTHSPESCSFVEGSESTAHLHALRSLSGHEPNKRRAE